VKFHISYFYLNLSTHSDLGKNLTRIRDTWHRDLCIFIVHRSDLSLKVTEYTLHEVGAEA
jgi:hypothetical protein